jgi:FkbH-like protein
VVVSDRRTILLIADFTVSGLAGFLGLDEPPPALDATTAPFDQVVPTLLDEHAECWESNPSLALVWTRPQTIAKTFARVLNHERVPPNAVRAEVDQFVETLRMAARRVAAVFVPTWTWPSYDRGLGVLNMDPTIGPTYFLSKMNTWLAEAAADDSAIHVLDAGRWVAQAGALASHPKLWHLGKIAFGPEVFKHAASDIKAAVRALEGAARKLVVVDLDDTLWGGVVGDIGWQNLDLGGHSPAGEAFTAFQRALKRLTSRGIVLAIVSKNTESLALEAIDSHPEQVLRRNDFVGWRINWDDKARNIVSLVSELNLGLDSVVYIDDNPAERARIRQALPQVLVPDWPADKMVYEQALAELTCFDGIALSEEDRARTRMYVAERQRHDAEQSAQSIEAYLLSLGLAVTVERLGPTNIVRAAQLLNKTNQMNLSTRRLSEVQFLEWAASTDHHVFVFRVRDRFEDYGLTGIASMTIEESQAMIADFVLSCRVIGRGVEETMLHVLVDQARSLGLRQLLARYDATPRNGPCRRFFDEKSGLSRNTDDLLFSWDLARPYSAPDYIAVRLSVSGQG